MEDPPNTLLGVTDSAVFRGIFIASTSMYELDGVSLSGCGGA
jgi:hypothetical protein